MWDFEHPPLAAGLAQRYSIHYTKPALCAVELHEGRADLGLIPIAALTPELAIVPGCTIASLDNVRSILLLVKGTHDLSSIRTVAADTASRSSLAYVEVLLRRFSGVQPQFLPAQADPIAMLQQADAAVLIGDPALLAREHRQQIEQVVGPCQWLDVAHEWKTRTGLPWVAAVWAVRPQAIPSPAQLIEDLQGSRDHGLAHIEDLVAEWTPRIAVPPGTIRTYLTQNIHYTLTPECIETIQLLRAYAAEESILPPLGPLRFL